MIYVLTDTKQTGLCAAFCSTQGRRFVEQGYGSLLHLQLDFLDISVIIN